MVCDFSLHEEDFSEPPTFIAHFQLPILIACAVLSAETMGSPEPELSGHNPDHCPRIGNVTYVLRMDLKSLARPTGFQPVTAAFGAR